MPNNPDVDASPTNIHEYPESTPVRIIYANLKKWHEAYSDWITKARENYRYIEGDQWDETELEDYTDARRPAVSFNRLGAYVRGIVGMYRANQMDVSYTPRGMEDAQGAQLLTQAVQWVTDQSMLDEEEAIAFRDMLITGIGWLEVMVDEDPEEEGEYIITGTARSPLTVAWSPEATRPGLVDATWIATWRRMPKDDALLRWPDKADVILGTAPSQGSKPEDANEEKPYRVSAEGDDYRQNPWNRPPDRDYVTIIQYQRRYRAKDPFNPGKWSLKYEQIFLMGREILSVEPLDAGFSFIAFTGIYERASKAFKGLVQDLIDPQRWANRTLSLGLDILATQAKGGLMAEVDAFVNVKKAQKDWSDPRKIVWLKPGGLQKIQERMAQGVNPSVFQTMEFAIEAIQHVSGMSLEFLGLAGKVQPGVLEYQRKQSTVTMLGDFFASARRAKRLLGRLLGKYTIQYLQGRIVRIIGPSGAEQAQLIFEPGFVKFDVQAGESINALDARERYWQVLMNLIPFLANMGIPIPPEVFDYIPIPADLVAKFKQSYAATVGMGAIGGPQSVPIAQPAARAEGGKSDVPYAPPVPGGQGGPPGM